MIQRNPYGKYPEIDATAYIHPTAVLIGDIVIGRNVFVGPGAVIRADEQGSSVAIKDNCNIQDGVIIHALENTAVTVEANTSLAHGCIVHGPCRIGNNCFIGFGSVIFKAELGEGTAVKHLSVVEGVSIPPAKLVESMKLIKDESDIGGLKNAGDDIKIFTKRVVEVNTELSKKYREE